MDLIRPATPSDYEALCPLFEEGDAHHRRALPHIFQEAEGPARSEEYYAAMLDDENTALLVAERDGRIAGLICITLREAPDIPILVPRRYAIIDNLVVSEGFRRSGLGRALVERAERWAAERGASQVELNVWEFNRGAMALYETLGYETASRRMCRDLRTPTAGPSPRTQP